MLEPTEESHSSSDTDSRGLMNLKSMIAELTKSWNAKVRSVERMSCGSDGSDGSDGRWERWGEENICQKSFRTKGSSLRSGRGLMTPHDPRSKLPSHLEM